MPADSSSTGDDTANSSSTGDDTANLRALQYQREGLRLGRVTAESATYWFPGTLEPDDFWQTIYAQSLDHDEVTRDRLTKLIEAVRRVSQPDKGKPDVLRQCFNQLRKLPSFVGSEKQLTAAQWTALAFAQSLRALLEMAHEENLAKPREIKKAAQESGVQLKSVFISALDGFKMQIAAAFLPNNSPTENDWMNAQRKATQALRHPDLFSSQGESTLKFSVRTLVEFICAYCGLFKKIENEASIDVDRVAVGSLFIGLNGTGAKLSKGNPLKGKPLNGNHPMLVEPRPWQYSQRGGHLIFPAHLSKSAARNAPAADMLRLMDRSDMPVVFNALNQLQNTKWRINKQVLACAQAIFWDAEAPNRSPSAQKLSKNASCVDSAECLQKKRLACTGPGWESDLGDLIQREAFYFPYQLDYRGRIYPQCGWLSPQGDDLAKGLLEFASGKCINPDDDAKRFLAIYGAQLADNTGITDPSLDSYVDWIERNDSEIRASAQDPLNNGWWLEHSKSKSRWQMLAFCFAWENMRLGKPVHLPVQVDGSCNGLQHMAALLRDKKLGQHTNLLASKGKQKKQDLYSWIGEELKEDILSINNNEGDEAQPLAAWVCEREKELLNRSLAKKIVMTFGYGSTKYKDAIFSYLEEQFIFSFEPGNATGRVDEQQPLDAHSLLKSIELANQKNYRFPNARYIPNWDNDSARKGKENSEDKDELSIEYPTSKEIEAYLRRGAQQSASPLPMSDKKLGNFLRDRLASFLTQQFKDVMNEHLKNAVELRKCLEKWSNEVMDATLLPPIWVTPAGFPVIQLRRDKDKDKGKNKDRPSTIEFDSTLYGKLCKEMGGRLKPHIEFSDRRQVPRSEIDFFLTSKTQKRHRTAFPPNFIHSLDAAHLMLTINRCQQLGIRDFVAVHDSFGTHASDVAKLGRALRDSFIQLHRQPLLEQYRPWLQHLIHLASGSDKDHAPHSEMHAAVLGMVRDYWLAVREGSKAESGREAKLGCPPVASETFEIDEIGQSDYIFF